MIDPDMLLRAYAIGVFPMSDGRAAREVYWVEPRRRAILPLAGFHLSRSLRKTLRSGRFAVTRDTAFAEVIRRCAHRSETWINPEIEESYIRLHTLGQAHSVETWADGQLVGGLYGVRLGGAFFGESMFSDETDASKVALAWLVARMIAGGFQLLDCQFMTDHLRSLGATEVTQQEYLQLLSAALDGSAFGALGSGRAAGGVRGRPVVGAGEAEFEALDRLLSGASSSGTEPGWVIAQLLTQTS
jgi:leucyl/phenylalanyl-tRNA--protein transferase